MCLKAAAAYLATVVIYECKKFIKSILLFRVGKQRNMEFVQLENCDMSSQGIFTEGEGSVPLTSLY